MTRNCLWCQASFTPATKGRGKHRRYCSENHRKAHWTNTHRPRCACGALVSYGRDHCWDCEMQARSRKRVDRWTRISTLWGEGLPMAEIAPRVGRNVNSLGVEMARMRHAGWALPYRRAGWKGHIRSTGPPKKSPRTPRQVHERLHEAVRTNKLDRPDQCEHCGREGYVDGHHTDYSKPLEVEWLCRACHMTLHAAQRKVAA